MPWRSNVHPGWRCSTSPSSTNTMTTSPPAATGVNPMRLASLVLVGGSHSVRQDELCSAWLPWSLVWAANQSWMAEMTSGSVAVYVMVAPVGVSARSTVMSP